MNLSYAIQKALFPATLRAVRHLTGGRFDYRQMRRNVARVERLMARREHGGKQSPVSLAHCPASWLEVGETRPDQVILYLHGGGFIFETPALHSALLARLCDKTGSCGFMPHYRLAPEHPYPAATEDCLDAYRYLLAAGFSPRAIVIVGDSAGGNLTLVTLLRIRAASLPLPAGAIALSPATDLTGRSDSMQRNAGHDPVFSPGVYAAMIPYYLPDPLQRGEPWASPLYGDLAGLPPIHLLVGSSELLLDDSVRFACKCPSATLEVWHNMPHVFPAFDFLPEAQLAQMRMARHVLALYAGEAIDLAVDHKDWLTSFTGATAPGAPVASLRRYLYPLLAFASVAAAAGWYLYHFGA